MDGGMIAILFLALLVIVLIFIIYFIIIKRKKNKSLLPVAIEWVDEAKTRGLTYDQIKGELKAKGWSGSIIHKALKINGVSK